MMWEEWNESLVTLRFKEYLANRVEEIGQNYKESIMNGDPQVSEDVAYNATVCQAFSDVLSIDLADLNGVSPHV